MPILPEQRPLRSKSVSVSETGFSASRAVETPAKRNSPDWGAPCATLPTHTTRNAEFDASLREFDLFRGSSLEQFAANLLYPISGVLQYRRAPEASQVVRELTLWEKFLAHRSRFNRRMTFSVAYHEAAIAENSYIPRAVARFYQFLLDERNGWQNQPLNVHIGKLHRSHALDPREWATQELSIGIVDQQNQLRIARLDWQREFDSPGELQTYVNHQLEHADYRTAPVAVIFDEVARTFSAHSGSYASVPGAWLRFAPDRVNHGLISTADHMVLDGALHQKLLLQVASAAVTPLRGSQADRMKMGPVKSQSRENVLSFEIPGTESLCQLMLQIGDSLDENGIRLRTGHETALLTTLPQLSPSENCETLRGRGRILPVLLQMRNTDSPAEVRAQIQNLNQQGMRNPLAYALDRIYCGTTHPWMIGYFEYLSMRIPFQQAGRFLNGSALISCLPAAEPVDLNSSGNSRLVVKSMSATTLRGPHGIPAILVQQVPNPESSSTRRFISFSGSRHWDCPKRLAKLANSVRKRLGLEPLS